MADDQDQQDAERAAIRERYLAARARLTAIDPQELAAKRAAEIQIVRDFAAGQRRNAA
jgi:hypothetical protein